MQGAGYQVFDYDRQLAQWAAAAHAAGLDVLKGDGERRHGGTWFVGVDALPNAADGSVDGVQLGGAWLSAVEAPANWHAAQLSVVFPGYPQQDPEESDGNHRFRKLRDAAHVDGLLPVGPTRRRFLLEPHSFIAGFPLNACDASPLVVWPGSHAIMAEAFHRAFAGHAPDDWAKVDVTEVYQAARKQVFETCPRVELRAKPGQVMLLHRHLVHGVAPWGRGAGDMRMVAYFRPQGRYEDWLPLRRR